jgi:xanthine dehydrogenase accessory factor
VIVLGCDEIGSAVAHRLHVDGYSVVLIDRIDPPWARRGMALTDAWYEGTAQLAGVAAVFCASVRSIPAVLDRAGAIAATAWSWAGVAGTLSPIAMIETRAPSARRTPIDRKTLPPLLTIEVMPGALAGAEFDVAVALPPRQAAGARVLYAPATGFFATSRAIGDAVQRGDTLGGIAGVGVIAPVAGRVRALSARGARVHTGCEIAEIDPRGDFAGCFGLDPRAEAIARAASEAIQRERPLRGSRPAPFITTLQGA